MLLENSTLSQGFLFPSKPQHWSPSVFLWLLKHPSKLKNKAQNHLNCLAKGLERSTTFCSEDNFRKQKEKPQMGQKPQIEKQKKNKAGCLLPAGVHQGEELWLQNSHFSILSMMAKGHGCWLKEGKDVPGRKQVSLLQELHSHLYPMLITGSRNSGRVTSMWWHKKLSPGSSTLLPKPLAQVHYLI